MNFIKKHWDVFVIGLIVYVVVYFTLLSIRDCPKDKKEIKEPVKEESINSVSLKCTYCNHNQESNNYLEFYILQRLS